MPVVTDNIVFFDGLTNSIVSLLVGFSLYKRLKGRLQQTLRQASKDSQAGEDGLKTGQKRLKGRLENSRLVGWKILKRRLGKNQRRVIKDSKAGYKRLKGRLQKTQRQARKDSQAG